MSNLQKIIVLILVVGFSMGGYFLYRNLDGENNTEANIDYSTLLYDLRLPLGWDLTDRQATTDPCGEGSDITWVTATFESAEGHSIKILENGNPNGCGGDRGADVRLDYSFTKSGIDVFDDNVEFCDKETNVFCPSGDNNLRIYVQNIGDESYTKHPKNGNSYFFLISIDNAENNRESQVKSFISLIETINFN